LQRGPIRQPTGSAHGTGSGRQRHPGQAQGCSRLQRVHRLDGCHRDHRDSRRVDGFIEQRLFDAGQLVKANELLHVLDQGVCNAELQKTKAAMAKAEAELRFAKEKEVVEAMRAESRLAQSRAALAKADQDVARYRSLVRKEAAS
jgi:hypothetical protein